MTSVALLLAAVSSSFAGFAALSLAMERHRRDVQARRPVFLPAPAILRTAGCLFLVLSLLNCVQSMQGAVGTVAWVGVLTIAAMAVILTLTYRSSALVPAGGVAAFAALVASAGTMLKI